MPPRNLSRLANAAVVTGVAAVAFAVPSTATADPPQASTPESQRHAQHVPSGTGLTSRPAPAPAGTDEGTPWGEIGVAFLGGLALAGAGIGAAAVVRRRTVVHPA